MLSNRYKVLHKLGHGGMATIWLARDLTENRYVAVKIQLATAPLKEVNFLAHLRDHGEHHPSIVSLQDAFTIKGPNGLHQCMVFDAAGPSLHRMADGQHQIPAPIARKAGQKLAEGLAHLHAISIVHGGRTPACSF